MAPAISVIQRALPTLARGMGVAIFTLITTFAGSLAVYLVGATQARARPAARARDRVCGAPARHSARPGGRL